MNRCILISSLLLLPLAAQDQKQHFTINVGTPEGVMLQSIGSEPDDEKKLPLALDFLAKYPKHEGAVWVANQAETIYIKQKEYDKALEVGEKTFADNPTDLELDYNTIKAAEGKEDPGQLKTWCARASDLARKTLADAKAPADEDEKQHVEYVKGVQSYSEYALYALALKLKDPKQVAELGSALEEQNVKSPYMAQLSGVYLNALTQSGQAAKACTAAEKLATANTKDVDAGVNAANCSLQKKQYDRAVAYSSHVLEALGSRSKPEGMSDADWASKKSMLAGRANWIAGMSYASENKLGPADKSLRAALPSVKGEPLMLAPALFQLALANYQLGKALGDKAKIKDGLQFFQQCADISGPYQDQASKNVTTIKRELGVR
ncbi:MAG TPA: hypothetical protein VKT81_04950 [Bryobacteraceae bacterium]|nr:hypothetical protein [Bryobacteraceae bacterium]